jgi:hypothetical protein
MFTMVSNVLHAFSQVFQTLVLSVSSVLVCMLHLYILKVERDVAHGMRIGSG